jgi:hypothetical protein
MHVIHNKKFLNFRHNFNKWCFMVFRATFNNISVISWWSVLLVEKTNDLPQEWQYTINLNCQYDLLLFFFRVRVMLLVMRERREILPLLGIHHLEIPYIYRRIKY